MEVVPVVRIDKWLWSIRVYKSRSLATAACTGGKVRIEGAPVKPSRSVKVGEIITAVAGDITRTLKVIGLLEHRVGAKIVPQYAEDLTPAAEYLKPRTQAPPLGQRPRGSGRPTKKERRELEALGLD